MRPGRAGAFRFILCAIILSALAAPLVEMRNGRGGNGEGVTPQETWLSLFEGDGVSSPGSEGWWVRPFGGTITPGVSDGATVAIRDDNSEFDGGWMQRYIDFTPPFKIAARARYDPTTTTSGDVGIPYVYTGTHSFGAIYLPDHLLVGANPTISIPVTQGEWHNVTFDAKAPLDLDVYVDGVFVRNVEMSPAVDITFDQPDCKPAITALTTQIAPTAKAMVDYIRTTLPVIQEGPVKNCERMPPTVSPRLDDGTNPPSADLTVDVGVGAVWLNATVDDSATGGSTIWSANYTLGPGTFPGTAMTASDGAFDSTVEDVTSVIDVGSMSFGNYTYCIYGRDYLGNWDPAGTCAVLRIVQTPPVSMVDQIVPYWRNTAMTITATSIEGSYPIVSLGLCYRHSIENSTWGQWTIWGDATSAPWTWTFSFPDGGGYYAFYSIANDSMVTEDPPPVPDALAAYDVTPPTTAIALGLPRHLGADNFITSHTPVTLTALDGGVAAIGIDSIYYRIDGGSPRLYSGAFTVSDEGDHAIEYSANDLLNNSETPKQVEVVVDDTPPSTAIAIGLPSYMTGGTFVRSNTSLSLSASDGGAIAVGLASIRYRMDQGAWADYSSSFTLSGEGAHTVAYFSSDLLGNAEDVRSITVVVDDTPPATSLLIPAGGLAEGGSITLTAVDAASGVSATYYRLDGGSWTVYTDSFTLPKGEHTIYYYSIDNLGNVEQERSLVVRPPIEVTLNYKPLVAAVFAVILAVAGLWSSRRSPWKGEKGRMAVVRAFMITTMPFVLGEVMTGILSFWIEPLRIPPLLGWGTGVDCTILAAGLLILIARVTWKRGRKSAESSV